MPNGDQRDPYSGASAATVAPTQTRPLTFWDLLPATPHGQPFVPMIPPRDQFDPWNSSAIRGAPVAPGGQLAGADRAMPPGFLGLALGQSGSGGVTAEAAILSPMVTSGG